MEVLPAIDLLGTRCVRMIQGRYDRVIEYDRDAVEVAERFRAAGARWLHVVDLEGARNGRIENLATLRALATQTGLQVQFGGGVRDEAAIDAALAAGAARVIIGTRALEDWAWFERMAHRPDYAGRLALGLDARVGKLAVRGWTRDTERLATDVARALHDWPVTIVYTDIGHDGLLLGPNLRAVRELRSAARVPVIAAGGVSDADDIRQLAAMELAGVVIGRALYEERLRLEDALAAARTSPAA